MEFVWAARAGEDHHRPNETLPPLYHLARPFSCCVPTSKGDRPRSNLHPRHVATLLEALPRWPTCADPRALAVLYRRPKWCRWQTRVEALDRARSWRAADVVPIQTGAAGVRPPSLTHASNNTRTRSTYTPHWSAMNCTGRHPRRFRYCVIM
jgi:hypothetical protein